SRCRSAAVQYGARRRRTACRICRRSSARDRSTPAARASRRGSPPAPRRTRMSSCRRRPCRRKTGCACPERSPGACSAARHAADRRAVHPHPPVPGVELFEEERIDVEEVDRRRVGQADELHEALEHEQVVEIDELLAQPPLVLRHEVAVQEFAEMLLEIVPAHSRLPSRPASLFRGVWLHAPSVASGVSRTISCSRLTSTATSCDDDSPRNTGWNRAFQTISSARYDVRACTVCSYVSSTPVSRTRISACARSRSAGVLPASGLFSSIGCTIVHESGKKVTLFRSSGSRW